MYLAGVTYRVLFSDLASSGRDEWTFDFGGHFKGVLKQNIPFLEISLTHVQFFLEMRRISNLQR